MTDDNGISRRDLLLGAGVMAAGYSALAPMTAQAAQAPGARGNVGIVGAAVEIDGVVAGLAKAVQGGGAKAEFRAPSVPAGNKPQMPQITNIGQEPVVVRFITMPGAKFPEWFAARDLVPRNVAIIMFDQNYNEIYRLAMTNARIVALRLPDFDAMARSSLEFEVTFLAERSAHLFAGPGSRRVNNPARKPVTAAGFRLMVQGLEKISNSTMRVALPSFELSPGTSSWISSPLKFSVAFDAAGVLYDWLNAVVLGTPVYRAAQLQVIDLNGGVQGSVDLVNCVPVAVSTPFRGSMAASGDAAVSVDVEALFSEAILNLQGVIG